MTMSICSYLIRKDDCNYICLGVRVKDSLSA